jgi:gluconolactonase
MTQPTQIFDPRAAELVPAHAQLERLATGAAWSEGPIWIAEENCVLWSDIPNNRLLRWHAQTGMTVWRDNVEFTNGHYREANGALLHCSHGLRAVVRTRVGVHGFVDAAKDEIVVSHYQGKRLNSPNDVVVKSDGTIWFTDPPYGILSNHEGHAAPSELGDNYVFCFDPRTQELNAVSDAIEEPNGLAFSPDEEFLYVSDTSAALAKNGAGNHHIVRFNVVEGCTLSTPQIFAVIEPGLADGFRLDAQGWLYTSSADSVQVFHPDGTRLAKIFVPEKVGNVTFGGTLRDELYICASTSLYRIRLNTRGVQTP